MMKKLIELEIKSAPVEKQMVIWEGLCIECHEWTNTRNPCCGTYVYSEGMAHEPMTSEELDAMELELA